LLVDCLDGRRELKWMGLIWVLLIYLPVYIREFDLLYYSMLVDRVGRFMVSSVPRFFSGVEIVL